MRIGDLDRRVGNTPDDDVDFIVMGPKHGIGWEYPGILEVMT